MTAGSPMLTAPLGPGNGFRADLNAGQRVTVTDASPGGATLLSDVVGVINATTIRSADSASTTCRMPWPSLIGLTWSDWTTTSAPAPQALTVNLGNRVVSDAQSDQIRSSPSFAELIRYDTEHF
jgi:hypothetical protein